MAIKKPTIHANGVSTAEPDSELVWFGMPDPTKWIVYFNDFTKPTDYDTNDWTVTTTEAAGTATEAISDANGGILVLTNGTADDDVDQIQSKTETFLCVAGKRMFFKCRLKISDATQSDWAIGIAKTDTTVRDVSDGIIFASDDGDAYVDFKVIKDSSTSTNVNQVATSVSDTYIVLGFYYNGVDRVDYFVDESYVGGVAATNIPDDEEMAIVFNIQNGAVGAKAMSIDYVFVANER